MRGIKIPQQDFELKRQGGGGIFVGHYGINRVFLFCHITSKRSV